MQSDKKHILVVDDEKEICEILSVRLKKWGYRVTTANSSEDALSIIEPQNFHLILSDIRMPGKFSGIEFFEEIKRRFLFMPVFIFMTGSRDISPRKAFEMGACGFIDKPIDFNRIKILIEEALKKYPRFKRRFKRVEKKFDIRLNFSGCSKFITCGIENICSGGAFMCIDELPEIGQKIELEIIDAPVKKEKIEESCEIIWKAKTPESVDRYGYGVRFIDTDTGREKIIDHFKV